VCFKKKKGRIIIRGQAAVLDYLLVLVVYVQDGSLVDVSIYLQ
jgi:hypothetical protein